MPTEPEVRSQAGTYQLHWRDEYLDIRVDRLHTEKGGVYGEILIRTTSPGYHPHIHGPVRFNLVSTTARRQLTTHLNAVIALDWSGILEQTCYRVVEAHRAGVPTIHIASHEMPESLGMRIDPILQEKQAAVFFGDGDSLKSYLATYLSVITHLGITHNGLTPEPGNVLFLDYETDADTFWERINMISAGLGVGLPEGIYYRHEIESVVDDIAGIKHAVQEHAIDLVVVDSAAPATIEPEKAEYVIPFFRALRSLDATTLTIAHQTKNAKGEYPFGSTFWRNLPRSNFHIKADRHSEDVAVSLKHTKSNNGRRLKPLGFSFAFDDNGLVITAASPGDYEELAKDVPLRDRIKDALLRGMKTPEVLAEELGAPQDSIRKTLNRGKESLFMKYGNAWGVLQHE